jgi:hypothetical protein
VLGRARIAGRSSGANIEVIDRLAHCHFRIGASVLDVLNTACLSIANRDGFGFAVYIRAELGHALATDTNTMGPCDHQDV